jgi:hypothetical protein
MAEAEQERPNVAEGVPPTSGHLPELADESTTPEAEALAPGSRFDSAAWTDRNNEVVELAMAIALDEVKESVKPFDQVKARAAVVFSATSAAIAFLVGSALRDADRDTLNFGLVYSGIVAFALFGVVTVLTLWPINRKLYLSGVELRDKFIRRRGVPDGEVRPSHAFDLGSVKRQIIEDADQIVEWNLARLRLLRWGFIAMLVFATTSVTLWALVVAYSSSSATP